MDPAAAGAGDDGFNLIIDAVCCGITRQFAMTAVARGGVIVHVGLMDSDGSLDMRKHATDEIILAGSYTYLPEDLVAAIRALHEGALGSLDWVEERALSEGPAAFVALSQGSSAAAKIVLRPSA
jgi:threonine dehydrogenase-like Zn-dependent dehydrogenase